MIDTTMTRRPRKMARDAKIVTTGLTVPEGLNQPGAFETPKTAVQPETKTTMVLGLLRRPEGATLEQLVAATGWLPHSARAALTGLRKRGHVLVSEKVEDGPRTYRIHGEGCPTAGGAKA